MTTIDTLLALADRYAQATRWHSDDSGEEARSALHAALVEALDHPEQHLDMVAQPVREPLPELPEPHFRELNKLGVYTEAQMLALRAETVEACAKVCDSKSLPMEKAAWCIARNCADAIRGMKP